MQVIVCGSTITVHRSPFIEVVLQNTGRIRFPILAHCVESTGIATYRAGHRSLHPKVIIVISAFLYAVSGREPGFGYSHRRMHPTDEELVAQYIERDDQAAFRRLVERHQERIFGYLMGMVRDRDVANDLFQETFVKAVSAMQDRRGSYDSQGRWLAWIMRIARNAALDHLRSRKKWIDVNANGEAGGDSYWSTMPDGQESPEDSLSRKQNGEVLEACISRLPDEQREVLLLRHEADMPFKEIAQLTGCSINTALGRMRYALLNLRKMIEGFNTEAHKTGLDYG